MDTLDIALAVMTVTMFVATFQAWRLGNEKRDVLLLGGFGGLFGAGTAVAAFI